MNTRATLIGMSYLAVDMRSIVHKVWYCNTVIAALQMEADSVVVILEHFHSTAKG